MESIPYNTKVYKVYKMRRSNLKSTSMNLLHQEKINKLIFDVHDEYYRQSMRKSKLVFDTDIILIYYSRSPLVLSYPEPVLNFDKAPVITGTR